MYLLNSQTAFIQIHLLFALAALLVGAAQLAFGKGTPQHRLLGRLWVAMIAVICVTSFWIKELMPTGAFGGYSPIHLLSISTLFTIGIGVYQARTGRITAHKWSMTLTYLGGLLIAGAFTFFPGRLLHKIFLL